MPQFDRGIDFRLGLPPNALEIIGDVSLADDYLSSSSLAANPRVAYQVFGHQIVAHLSADSSGDKAHNDVDGEQVPVRHFGVVLSLPAWEALASKFKAAAQEFVIEPHVRFRGEPGEQATMFFLDPFGNALEFKAFADPDRLFAK